MLELFTIPSASSVVSSSSDYATTLFTSFSPLIWVAIGIFAAVALARFLMKRINGGIKGVAGSGRRKGGFRRK